MQSQVRLRWPCQLYVSVKLEGKLGHLGYLGYRVSSHREVTQTYMVIFIYPLTIFNSDLTFHSLDRLTTLQTRANEPFKNSHFARIDSLDRDYFRPNRKITYPPIYFHLLRFIFVATHFVVDTMRKRVDKRASTTQWSDQHDN